MLLNDQPTPLMSALGTHKSLSSCVNESFDRRHHELPRNSMPVLNSKKGRKELSVHLLKQVMRGGKITFSICFLLLGGLCLEQWKMLPEIVRATGELGGVEESPLPCPCLLLAAKHLKMWLRGSGWV